MLLAAFTIVLVRAQTEHVPCLCFGTASLEAPAGPWAIVRNGYLAALAVIAIGNPAGANVGATIGLVVVLGALAAAGSRLAR